MDRKLILKWVTAEDTFDIKFIKNEGNFFPPLALLYLYSFNFLLQPHGIGEKFQDLDPEE
jgi:hypothetical protein